MKEHKSRCERGSFTVRKGIFYNAKDGLLQTVENTVPEQSIIKVFYNDIKVYKYQ